MLPCLAGIADLKRPLKSRQTLETEPLANFRLNFGDFCQADARGAISGRFAV